MTYYYDYFPYARRERARARPLFPTIDREYMRCDLNRICVTHASSPSLPLSLYLSVSVSVVYVSRCHSKQSRTDLYLNISVSGLE